jgi:hypothetical protein
MNVRYSPNMVQEALSLPVPGQRVDRKIPPLGGDGPGQVRVDLSAGCLGQGNLRASRYPDRTATTYPMGAERLQTFGQTGLSQSVYFQIPIVGDHTEQGIPRCTSHHQDARSCPLQCR